MADTSIYSIKEHLVASVWVHERQHMGQTMSQVINTLNEWHIAKYYIYTALTFWRQIFFF